MNWTTFLIEIVCYATGKWSEIHVARQQSRTAVPNGFCVHLVQRLYDNDNYYQIGISSIQKEARTKETRISIVLSTFLLHLNLNCVH